MALQKNFNLYGHVNIPSGYYRVEDLEVEYHKNEMHVPAEIKCKFVVQAYNGDNGDKLPMAHEITENGNTFYEFDPSSALESGMHSLPQAAYSYLKTLDSFSDATDA
jgi:hypothetical protein